MQVNLFKLGPYAIFTCVTTLTDSIYLNQNQTGDVASAFREAVAQLPYDDGTGPSTMNSTGFLKSLTEKLQSQCSPWVTVKTRGIGWRERDMIPNT